MKSTINLWRAHRQRRNTKIQIAELEHDQRVLRHNLDRARSGHQVEGFTLQELEESIIEGDATLDYLRTRV